MGCSLQVYLPNFDFPFFMFCGIIRVSPFAGGWWTWAVALGSGMLRFGWLGAL